MYRVNRCSERFRFSVLYRDIRESWRLEANLALVSARKSSEDHATNMVGSSRDRVLLFKVIN